MRASEMMEALSGLHSDPVVGIRLQHGRGDTTWRTFDGLGLTDRPDVVEFALGDAIPAPETEVVFFEWGAACGNCGRYMSIAADNGDFMDAFEPLDTKAKVLDAYRGKLMPTWDPETHEPDKDPETGEVILTRQGFAQKGDRMRVSCDCGSVNYVVLDE